MHGLRVVRIGLITCLGRFVIPYAWCYCISVSKMIVLFDALKIFRT
jgi:hypothetical protein